MKTLLAIWLVALTAGVAAQEAPKPLGYVKEGVYVSRRGGMTNIIELKDGRFRLWNSFTANVGGLRNNPDAKPGPRFTQNLRSGEYKTNGSMVTIVTSSSTPMNRGTNEYACMEHKGKISLWSPLGQRLWKQNKVIPTVGILEATERKPEEILEGK